MVKDIIVEWQLILCNHVVVFISDNCSFLPRLGGTVGFTRNGFWFIIFIVGGARTTWIVFTSFLRHFPSNELEISEIKAKN